MDLSAKPTIALPLELIEIQGKHLDALFQHVDELGVQVARLSARLSLVEESLQSTALLALQVHKFLRTLPEPRSEPSRISS